MALEVQVQQDFSGGMYQSPARELIPANGCAKIVNGLLEVDGSVSRRGGSRTLFTTSGSPTYPVNFLWDGYLLGGARTLIGSGQYVQLVDATDSSATTLNYPVYSPNFWPLLRPAVGNGILVLANQDDPGNQPSFYAGARANVSPGAAGTITTTAGSTTVTGAGTNFSPLDRGEFILHGVTGVIIGIVDKVASATSLTLMAPAAASFAGVAYTPRAVYTPVSYPATSLPTNIRAVATISNPARFVYAVGGKIAFSAAGDFFAFDATDYHQLPQGAQVLGMETLRNVLFVFSTQGVFTISGMDYDLTDAQGNVQQRLEQINRDIILWDQRGIAGWSGALIVPGVDDVYLLTESAAPRALSEPIRTLYRGYVAAGYRAGGATVYRNHYFLPILNGATWVDTLVLRLDAGGWVQWSGDGGLAGAFATRGSVSAGANPSLLSVGASRMADLSGCFAPKAANKNDGDGSTHPFEVVTRDYTTGGLRANLVKKVRLGYELTDAAADSPTITAQYATGNTASYTSLAGSATVSDGQAAAPFTVGTARPRFIRFRFSSVAPAAKMQVKSVEVLSRSGGRQ